MPPKWSRLRFRFVWKLAQAAWFEAKGEFDRALKHLDQAAQIAPLRPSDRVQRAMLLLRSERTTEAHQAFAQLRDEFKGSQKAGIRYLRHYCTAMLSLLSKGSAQWAYEAKQAQPINCRQSLKRRFPPITIDEIHERIPPKPEGRG